jgi:hypothetical protein
MTLVICLQVCGQTGYWRNQQNNRARKLGTLLPENSPIGLPPYRPTALPVYSPIDLPTYRAIDLQPYRPMGLPVYRATDLSLYSPTGLSVCSSRQITDNMLYSERYGFIP